MYSAAAAADTAVVSAVAAAAYDHDLGLLAPTVADTHDSPDLAEGAAEFSALHDPAHPSLTDQPAPQLLLHTFLKRKHPDSDYNNDDDDYNDHG